MTVFCAFPFFNEIELLRIKLEELRGVVDFFIIVEDDFTHSGIPKPLYYWENRELFKKYNSRIIHQHLTDTPSNETQLYYLVPENEAHKKAIDCVKAAHWFDHNNLAYLHDTYAKEMTFASFDCWDSDDIVILGDLDEIPRARTLEKVLDNFDKNKIYHLQHDFNWYYANINKYDEIWYGNMVMSVDMFSINSFCEMRNFKKGVFVENGGWHISYSGGLDRIKTKIESWGEQSLNLPVVKNNIENNVKDCLTNGRDLFFRPAKFKVIPVEEPYLPKYLVQNQDEFSNLIYKA